MNILRFALIAFVPLISFAVISSTNSHVKDAIYPIRFYLTILIALTGSLTIVFFTFQNRSVSSLLTKNLKGSKVYLLMPILYCLWILLSSIFSSMPGYSWLGHPYTQFGSIMLLACITLVFIYENAAPIQIVVRSLAITTTIMAIVVVIESLGLRPLKDLISSQNMIYPAATIGHRPHLGGWFAITALAPVFFYRQRSPDFWFWCWLLSSVVGLSLSTTSSATIGVFAGLLIWFIWSFKKAAWKLPLLTLLIFFIGIFSLPSFFTEVALRLNTTQPLFRDYSSTVSFKPRIYMWKSAFSAALERPFFGWGDETFAYQVFRHLTAKDSEALFRAELGLGKDYEIKYSESTYFAYKPKSKDREIRSGTLLYIRPHNILIDEMYSRGFIGLALFILSALSLLYTVYKYNRKSLIYFIIMIMPYSIYLMAWFYVNSVTPLFFILIGTGLAEVKLSKNLSDIERV